MDAILNWLSRQFRRPFGGAPEADSSLVEGRREFSELRPILRDAPQPNAKSRLLVIADGPGATQTISFVLPLENLRRAGVLELMVVNEGDFEALTPMTAERAMNSLFDNFRPTHVVVSRCGGLCATGVVKACEARNLRYVMHLDDNLFAVPRALGEQKYRKYSSPERLHRLRLLCERADKIYVSTHALAAAIKEMHFSPTVVAGDIYCAPPASLKSFDARGDLIFGYMGSSGHRDDLEMVAPAISAVLDEIPHAVFETFGTIKAPARLKSRFGQRVREHAAAGSYVEFIELFKEMNWRCGIAPLRDNAFNACKANTKFIEYTVAGIPVVASDVAVYQDIASAGRGLLAGNIGAWTDGIKRMLTDERLAASSVALAQAHIEKRYTMDALGKQVVSILELKVD